jgi:hypothetical protein
LQGPFAFRPLFNLGVLPVVLPDPTPVVLPGIVLPDDIPPGVEIPGEAVPPTEGLPTGPAPAAPPAPPPAPPPPPPAANAQLLDTANAIVNIIVVIFITCSVVSYFLHVSL